MAIYDQQKTVHAVDDIELAYRLVVLEGKIDDSVAHVVIMKLLFLQSENRGLPIELHVNSLGGSVTAGMAILDTMDQIKNPILTFCFGLAAGMAALIVARGMKGHRRAAFDSRLGLVPIVCDYPHEISAAKLERANEEICKYLRSDTRLPSERILQSLQSDVYFSSYEARELGMVDHVGPECRVRNPNMMAGIACNKRRVSDRPV